MLARPERGRATDGRRRGQVDDARLDASVDARGSSGGGGLGVELVGGAPRLAAGRDGGAGGVPARAAGRRARAAVEARRALGLGLVEAGALPRFVGHGVGMGLETNS